MTIVEVGAFHVPWRIQGQPQQLLQAIEESRQSQEMQITSLPTQ